MSIESRRWDLAAELAAGHVDGTELPALAHLPGTDADTIRRMAMTVGHMGRRRE